MRIAINLEVKLIDNQYYIYENKIKKYWYWSYTSLDTAQLVLELLKVKWVNCAMDKYRDVTQNFFNDINKVKRTNADISYVKSKWLTKDADGVTCGGL